MRCSRTPSAREPPLGVAGRPALPSVASLLLNSASMLKLLPLPLPPLVRLPPSMRSGSQKGSQSTAAAPNR